MPIFMAAAAAASASSLFSYNRENYFFDKELAQKREYQGMDMRIRQHTLYREDVRDLVNLTVRKMDNYLLVNTLLLGATVTLWTEGRPDSEDMAWLVGLWSTCLIGGFAYYLLSVWLSLHASVAAHAFGVRLLTQYVRLPVPNKEQLDKAKFSAQEYEGAQFKDMFRIPVWKQQLRTLTRAMAASTQEDMTSGSDAAEMSESDLNLGNTISPVAMMRHVRLYRQLQVNWQSYDAYARVCMSLGTNQMVHALSYLALRVVAANQVLPAMCCVGIFTCCAWVIAQLDLALSPNIVRAVVALCVVPPFCATIAMYNRQKLFLIPIVYISHIVWIVFTTHQARADQFDKVALPTKFRSVLYLDVFGWLGAEKDEEEEIRDEERRRMSTVEEEESERPLPRGASRLCQRSQPQPQIPPALHALMLVEAQKLADTLREELTNWEGPVVRDTLGEQGAELLTRVSSVRERFEELMSDIAADPMFATLQKCDAPSAPAAARGSDKPALWLQLEWQVDGGDAYEFFFQCETLETVWEAPTGSVRICSLYGLEQELQALFDKVGCLMQFAPRPDAAANGSQAAAEPAQRNRELPDAAAARPESARRNVPGRGAVPPGQLPWYTVRCVSMILVFAWSFGAVMSFCQLMFGYNVFERHPGSLHEERRLQMQTLPWPMPVPFASNGTTVTDYAGGVGWPIAFLTPVDMACHDAFGPIGLIVGRHVIQEVQLGEADAVARASAAEIKAALETCLQQTPGFQGRGLIGLSFECPGLGTAESWACDALALRADGHQAVRCTLGRVPSHRAPRPLTLHGGPWRTVAATGDPQGSLWALREGGKGPVWLKPRPGATAELLPHMEIPLEGEAAPRPPTRLQVVGAGADQWLFGLGPGSMLRAWSLSDGGPSRTWQLPQSGAEMPKSTGLCVFEGGLHYFGGAPDERSAASFGVWRADLPGTASVPPAGALAAPAA